MFQIKDWHQTDNKPKLELMMTKFIDTHSHHLVSMNYSPNTPWNNQYTLKPCNGFTIKFIQSEIVARGNLCHQMGRFKCTAVTKLAILNRKTTILREVIVIYCRHRRHQSAHHWTAVSYIAFGEYCHHKSCDLPMIFMSDAVMDENWQITPRMTFDLWGDYCENFKEKKWPEVTAPLMRRLQI